MIRLIRCWKNQKFVLEWRQNCWYIRENNQKFEKARCRNLLLPEFLKTMDPEFARRLFAERYWTQDYTAT